MRRRRCGDVVHQNLARRPREIQMPLIPGHKRPFCAKKGASAKEEIAGQRLRIGQPHTRGSWWMLAM
jgi:hypothetical protein